MAEGFEPYHVPQQSRRDKLRVVSQSIENLHGCTNMVSYHDPSLLPPDLLNCASFQQQNNRFCEPSKQNSNPSSNTDCQGVKNEAVNLMGGYGGLMGGSGGGCSSSSTTHHHMYMDPQTSIQLNPSSIQDVNNINNPYHYTTQQGLRFLDHHHHQSLNGSDEVVVVYRPEPLSAANNTTGQGLSLSLSSSHANQTNFPLELNLQRFDNSSSLFSGSTSNELSRGSVPLGPFTGYASILKGSRFLKPAHQLLEELCDVGKGIYAEKFSADTTLMDPPLEGLGESGTVDDPQTCSDGSDNRRKSRLISMLHEVYRRYKQYYQQMQAVVASFESVAGLSNAAPFANLAFKSMSKHFRSLKNALIDQLQFTTKSQSHMNYENDEIPRFGNSGRVHCGQRAVHTGITENQPVWRPQRGLPERAVSVLRAWLFDHFLHPYPTDTDKLMLAKQTGLSRNQVSNWFINARVRLWKPMVEEIHMLETQEAQKISQRKEHNPNRLDDQVAASKTLAGENPSTSTPKTSDFPSKRSRNMGDNHVSGDLPMNLSYDNFSHHPHLAIGANAGGGNNGVQLTLGLHQNNVIGLSEPFPINAAQRFGLDANSQGYVVGGFEVQNRQFGRNIVGGQLVHDFVG